MVGTLWRRAFAVAAIAGLTLAACGQQGQPAGTTAPTAAPTGAATQAPAQTRGQGGNLTILYWQAVTRLNGHHVQGTKDYDGTRLVSEPLAATGPDGKPVAILASEVPTKANGGISADSSQITWKLKPGVKWSDGSDFTAADVVFTWKYVTDKETAAATAGSYTTVRNVEALDPLTVRVTYNAPTANPYLAFTSYTGYILQEKQYKDFIGAKAKDGPSIAIGTGPYKVVDFKPNDVVTYDINPNYRDPGKPFFKTVTFKGGGDATSAARAVCQTGDVDYAWNLQVEATVLNPMINAADSKCQMALAPSPNVERLLLNRSNPDSALGDKRGEPDTQHPFLSDLKVRQALAMAIDRAPIAALYGPAGKATCNVIVGVDAYDSPNTKNMPVCKTGGDIAGANKLLDEAGAAKGSDGIRVYKGTRMKVVYATTVNPLRQKEQAIVKDAWTQIGIDVELKTVQAGVFFGTEGDDTAAKFFTDVEMFTNGAGQITQDDYVTNYLCSEIKTRASNWSGSNYMRWCNKEYDALYEQFSKELDLNKRNELLIKMNDIIISDVGEIALVQRTSPTSGISKQLKGTNPSAWDSEMWNIADWSK